MTFELESRVGIEPTSTETLRLTGSLRELVRDNPDENNKRAESRNLIATRLNLVRKELTNGSSQRLLSKQNHPFQTGLLYARTKRSAYLFRIGDRGGSFTDFVPASTRVDRNSA